MFIHLGGDTAAPKEEVIAILNMQLTKKNEINREFLSLAREEGFVEQIGDRSEAKSFIITTKKVYLSPISSMTLKKRSKEVLNGFHRDRKKKPW